MRLPDFFIIGAAKAGTTSLYKALSQHPELFFSSPKEPEFFARDDLYNDGLEGYRQLFEKASPHQKVGEASTLYSLTPHFPRTAERIRTHVPDAKFIYVMRQPVERAYSYYVQILKNYRNATGDREIHRSFEDCILPDRHARACNRDKVFADFDAHLPDVPELMLSGSEYVLQIQSYLEHFNRDQILFLKFEDYRTRPESVLQQITNFIGVSPVDMSGLKEGDLKTNVAKDFYRSRAENAAVEDIGKRFGLLWKAKALLPGTLRARARKSLIAKLAPDPVTPPPMEKATREMLTQRFTQQYEALSHLTGLDLSDWGSQKDAA